MKIKITIKRAGVSAIATINDENQVGNSFYKKLPIKAPLYHARWCGNEVFAPIGQVEYKEVNQTVFPSIGEISITPAGGGYNFGIWYGKSWAFGPEGYNPVSIIGKIEGELTDFVKACNDCVIKGADEVLIEKI